MAEALSCAIDRSLRAAAKAAPVQTHTIIGCHCAGVLRFATVCLVDVLERNTADVDLQFGAESPPARGRVALGNAGSVLPAAAIR